MSRIIDNWLKGGRNYTVGVAIYKTLGKDQLLKKLFDQHPTDYSKKRLQEELDRLNAEPIAVVAPIASIATIHAQEWKEMPESDDVVLKSLREQWKPIYAQMNYLRHELDQFKGNAPEMIEARKPLAFKILELEQTCMTIWSKRDHYQEKGRLPDDVVKDEEDEIPTDPVQLGKYIEGLSRNIRRNKRLMNDHPDQPQYAQRFNDYSEKYFKATGKDYKS